MCLALAECRGWIVATDDRRAIHVAQKAGLSVVSCPELVKAWADATRPDATSLAQVLIDIQTLAQFRPNPFDAWLQVVDRSIADHRFMNRELTLPGLLRLFGPDAEDR